jgi:hypothetical protein
MTLATGGSLAGSSGNFLAVMTNNSSRGNGNGSVANTRCRNL